MSDVFFDYCVPSPLYGQSKLGNILISNYFAKAHSAILVSCAVHPGPIKTELSRYAVPLMYHGRKN
jgi:NAD(P)-dependent dehydrogenase (short-subunit alcohol dehydrogenase family)